MLEEQRLHHGTGGKLSVAYIEQFGENTFREMSKMEFILQALTYKDVGKIIYSSAHSNFTQAIADFKAAIAQKVSLIVTYPDFGDAMLPVMKEATDAGIPVATYAWGYVTGPGTNYLTVVGEDTCALGKIFAYVMNTQVKSGNIAFLGGFPGNPCPQAGRSARSRHSTRISRSWRRSRRTGIRRRSSRSSPESSPSIPTSRAGATSTGCDGAGRPGGVQGRGDAVQHRADAQDGRRHHGLQFNAMKNPNLKMFYYTSGNTQIRVAFTAAMMKLKGAKIPPTIVFPIQLQNQRVRDSCVKGYPQQASATSLIPLSLLKRMYP